MTFYSPLRYPGGKNKLAKYINSICVINNINEDYIEPYAGGASVALHLLMEGKVKKITINDFDRSIYTFWDSVLNRTTELCELIKSTEINIENWKKAKAIQKRKKTAKPLELGFSTLFLNRTNRSGVMNAGVIGGKEQTGKYKMDCRFNKEEIIKRIQRIASKKDSIRLFNMDAAELIKKMVKASEAYTDAIFYFDPPYYLKGSSLYVNHYEHDDHEKISSLIKKIRKIHWIVSYDDTPEIENIYEWVDEDRKKKITLKHSINTNKKGKEILFFSKNLILPEKVLITGR